MEYVHIVRYRHRSWSGSSSLEAIFLTIFVLGSQNRQAAKGRISADLDYQVNVKAEMEMSIMASQIREIESKLHHIHRDLLEAKTT